MVKLATQWSIQWQGKREPLLITALMVAWQSYMVGPQRSKDEVMDCGVGLVPGVVETIIFCLEVNKSIWLDTNPLQRVYGERERERERERESMLEL